MGEVIHTVIDMEGRDLPFHLKTPRRFVMVTVVKSLFEVII